MTHAQTRKFEVNAQPTVKTVLLECTKGLKANSQED